MPGTLVADALAYELFDDTITSDTTTTGDPVLVSKPGWVQIEVTLGTLTGDGSTTTDIEIEGCDASAFSTGVVSYGRFSQLENDDEDGQVLRLNAYVDKSYMRAVIITDGGVSSAPITIVVRDPHYKRTSTFTA